ncbi:MAG: hypothetical protein ABI772_06505 [Bacteroidota bacterium]
MIKQSVLLLLLLFCSRITAQVITQPDSSISLDKAMERQQEYAPSWLISGTAGFGYRLAKLPDNLNSFEQEYYRKLKSGYYYQFNAAYYFKKGQASGIGIIYNTMHTDNEIKGVTVTGPAPFNGTGSVSDDITISYTGLQWHYRYWNYSHNGFLNGYLGLGYMSYKDKAVLIKPYTLKGNALGLNAGAAYYIQLSPEFWLGAYGGYLAGTITEFELDDGNTKKTIKLEDSEGEGLHHIDIGVTIAVTF